ncbi:MAG: efflux RND transporter periplasmic adaptor subunit [Opitutae bacterium]|nr:efflux RND transporter periplasmic adaptor subunit [Opitutae bacterium]MBC9889312.1 efflux RND transporter periplasmic adaptor subunit [Opitutae bacterium]
MNRRRKSKTKIAVFSVLIAVIAGSIVVAINWKKEDLIEVTVEEAERRSITSMVSATGRIFPEIEVKISSEVAGEIIELPVVEGQRVEKGDLLVKVDPDRYETQLRQRKVSINTAEARSLEAKAQRLQAQQDLGRVEELFTKGFVSEKELEDGRTLLEIRKVQEESAMLEIERAKSSWEEAEEALSKTVTFAPMNGTITKLGAELGERVVGTGQFAGTEILRVADLSNMEVRIEVSETDIVHVKVNDKATVEVDAIPDEEFDGWVTEISSSAANVRQDNDQLTTFEVRIRLDKPSPQLRPGMTATADIETETVNNAISVPMQSVTVRKKEDVRKALDPGVGQEDEKNRDAEDKSLISGKKRMADDQTRQEKRQANEDLQRIVFVLKDGKSIMREVKTGIADNTYIVIEEGIKVGEKVVSGSYRAITRQLNHDMEVKIKNPDKDRDLEEGKS